MALRRHQLHALDCLQHMERAKSDADRRAWKMLAAVFSCCAGFSTLLNKSNVLSKTAP